MAQPRLLVVLEHADEMAEAGVLLTARQVAEAQVMTDKQQTEEDR